MTTTNLSKARSVFKRFGGDNESKAAGLISGLKTFAEDLNKNRPNKESYCTMPVSNILAPE